MRKLLAPAVPIRQASNGSTEGQSPSKYMYMYSTCENLGPCVRRFPFLTNSSHSGSDTSHGESLAQLRSAWGATVKVVYHRQKLRSCLDRQDRVCFADHPSERSRKFPLSLASLLPRFLRDADFQGNFRNCVFVQSRRFPFEFPETYTRAKAHRVAREGRQTSPLPLISTQLCTQRTAISPSAQLVAPW